MGIMDTVKNLLRGHSNEAKTGVDKAGDIADQRTGGKYASHVDTAQGKANDFIDKNKDS